MKINQAGAYLDHMLRQTRIHHAQLSAMADGKANSLMTLAAVITTFAASFVAKPNFQAAVIVLMCFSLLTIILATLSVMPKTPLRMRKGQPVPTPELMKMPSSNLLFFGTFALMDYEQFEAAMEETMNDHSKTYQVQVREIYVLGYFLAAKKYRYLRFAYMSFLTGVLSSGVVLVVMNLGQP